MSPFASAMNPSSETWLNTFNLRISRLSSVLGGELAVGEEPARVIGLVEHGSKIAVEHLLPTRGHDQLGEQEAPHPLEPAMHQGEARASRVRLERVSHDQPFALVVAR